MEANKYNVVSIAERMLKAFKHVQCFIFEKDELQIIRNAIKKIGLYKHVRVRLIDPKYPLIYIVKPNITECTEECRRKADEYILSGKVRDELKKHFRIEYIRQCMNHCEHEKVKEIIEILKNFLEGRRSGITS